MLGDDAKMLNTLSDPLVVDVALVDDGWSVGKPSSGLLVWRALYQISSFMQSYVGFGVGFRV